MTKKSSLWRTTRKNHGRFNHPGNGTPEIGKEFQERIRLLFLKLVGTVLGEPLLSLGLGEALGR